MVAMQILLPWQQDRLSISQLFRGIERTVFVWRYFLAKTIISRNGCLGWGVRSGDEL